MRLHWTRIASVAAALLWACGSTAPVIPTLNISSPAKNSTVDVSNKMVAVNFDTNYTLRAPGQCGGQDTCGHVYLLVDGSACNQPNLPYNALALSSPVQADLGRCPMVSGMHTITLELHHDNGTVVQNLVGGAVRADVTFTAQVQP